MADNVAITAGSGTSIATDQIGSDHFQLVKLTLGAADANDGPVATGNPMPVRQVAQLVTVATDVVLPTSSIYGINDAISDSTSSPTTGGFTFTNAARASGGGGLITDAIITSSADAATLLQGEIWLFNQAVTAINDNAAFAVSDSEIKTCVGKIAFALEDAGNNGFYHATNLNIAFKCVGSANLRFLIKAKNAYTPATDTLTFVLKILQDG